MPHCEHIDSEVAIVSPHPSLHHVLTIVLLWQTCALSHMHPWLWPIPQSRSFGLSLWSHTQSSPLVLSTEVQLSAPSCCTHQQMYILGWGEQWVAKTVCANLCVLPNASQLLYSSGLQKLPICPG